MEDMYTARLACFVLLERDGKILFLLRANTGYMDGMYQMPSGKIDPNEYPAEAAIRETKEEAGVDIRPEDLEFVHVSHRINGNGKHDWVDFFFRAKKWTGEPVNAEPHKCDGLLWASPDELPENTVPVIREALEHIGRGDVCSGIGRRE